MKRFFTIILLVGLVSQADAWPVGRFWSAGSVERALYSDLIFHAPFTDPANPLMVYEGDALTSTRAHDATHTATYVHPATGILTVASADQLRIETAGALVEAAGTNLIILTEKLDNTTRWNVGGATITADNAVGPDDNATADLLTITSNGGLNLAYNANFIMLSNAPHTHSGWVKGTAGEKVYITINNTQTGADDTQALVTFTGAWQRASVTMTTNGTNRYSPSYEIYGRGGNSHLPNVAFHVCCEQLEESASSTSYIPAFDGIMSRTADLLTFPAIASPGTSIAKVDGTMQEVTYATFDPLGHHVRDVRVWGRTLSAAEIAVFVP